MLVLALKWGTGQWIGVVLAVIVLLLLIIAMSASKPGPERPPVGPGPLEEAPEEQEEGEPEEPAEEL